MSKLHPILPALLACAIAPLLQGASQLDEPTYDDIVYVNCQYRVAAIFPRAPMIRDITYTVAKRSVPARQFYVQQGMDLFSVIVADFTNGPAVDENLVAGAAVPLRQMGEVRFEAAAEYDPGIPGRQLNIFKPNGRQHRASVYMADHRLYITESDAVPGGGARPAIRAIGIDHQCARNRSRQERRSALAAVQVPQIGRGRRDRIRLLAAPSAAHLPRKRA